MQRALPAGIVLIAAFACTRADQPPQRFEFRAMKMSSAVEVQLYARSDTAAASAVRAAFARVEQIDSLLSDYRITSEVSTLAALPPQTALPMSADLHAVMKASLAMSRATDGAFDVTAGPLTQVWRAARRRDTIPNAKAVCAALGFVGWKRIEVDTAARTIRFDRSGMRLDFGGIAKGYAADEALAVLKARGISSALITFGGEIVAGDAPPGAIGWPVSVSGMTSPVMLANAALSTSGDEYQFIEIGGVRYSHVVDPRTGWALTNRVTATIRAPSGMIADAASTATTVLDSTAAAAFASAMPDVAIVQRTSSSVAPGRPSRSFDRMKCGS